MLVTALQKDKWNSEQRLKNKWNSEQCLIFFLINDCCLIALQLTHAQRVFISYEYDNVLLHTTWGY